MAKDLELVPGERIVWSNAPGRSVHLSPMTNPRVMVGLFLVIPYLLGMVIVAWLFAGGAVVLVGTVAAIVAAIAWRGHRARPAYFLSNHRLFQRGLFASPPVIPLAAVVRCRRQISRVRTRYGNVEEVPTQAAVLSFANGSECVFGPVQDIDDLLDLVHGAAIARNVDLGTLPGLDGAPPAAAIRTDLYVALQTRSGADIYGPVFIGPSKLLRFTDKLPRLLEAIFCTLLAGLTPADQIEAQLVEGLVRHPKAGHCLVLDLALVTLSVDGHDLRVKGPEREETITLWPADAARADAFVTARRRAHPMR